MRVKLNLQEVEDRLNNGKLWAVRFGTAPWKVVRDGKTVRRGLTFSIPVLVGHYYSAVTERSAFEDNIKAALDSLGVVEFLVVGSDRLHIGPSVVSHAWKPVKQKPVKALGGKQSPPHSRLTGGRIETFREECKQNPDELLVDLKTMKSRRVR